MSKFTGKKSNPLVAAYLSCDRENINPIKMSSVNIVTSDILTASTTLAIRERAMSGVRIG